MKWRLPAHRRVVCYIVDVIDAVSSLTLPALAINGARQQQQQRFPHHREQGQFPLRIAVRLR